MTVSSTLSRTSYRGNGSTTGFAVPFTFVRDEDIRVVLRDATGREIPLEQGSDYALSGAGDHNGGICTLTRTPAPGEILVLRREPNMVQEVDYIENDPFPAETHEAALDKLTMICQALSERLDRTVTFKVSSAVAGVSFPDPEPGRALAWNESGDNFRNGPDSRDIREAHTHAAAALSASRAAEDNRIATEQDRIRAEKAAAGLNLPPLDTGSARKWLRVTEDAEGYELRTVPQVIEELGMHVRAPECETMWIGAGAFTPSCSRESEPEVETVEIGNLAHDRLVYESDAPRCAYATFAMPANWDGQDIACRVHYSHENLPDDGIAVLQVDSHAGIGGERADAVSVGLPRTNTPSAKLLPRPLAMPAQQLVTLALMRPTSADSDTFPGKLHIYGLEIRYRKGVVPEPWQE